MNSNYEYLYEQSQLESFEKQILSGILTENKLAEMIDNGELSQTQRTIAEGFYDRLKARGAGLVQGAKAVGGNLRAGARAVGDVAMGQQPNLTGQLTNTRGAYTKGKADSLLASYNQKLSNSLNQYVIDLQKTNLLTPNISKLINALKQELGRIQVNAKSGGQVSPGGSRNPVTVAPRAVP